MPATEPTPVIRIDDASPDAVLGAIELTPILGSEGQTVDHLVTRAAGVGTTLLFGDLGTARGHRVSELDERRSGFLEQLLGRAHDGSSVALDLTMLDRLMRIVLTASTDGVMSIVFARVDAPAKVDPGSESATSARVERLRAMLSVLTDGVAMYDPVRDAIGQVVDFICLEMSDADPVLPASEQIGRRLLELYPETADNGTFDGYRRVIDTGEPWAPEPVTYQRNDQHYLYRLSATKIDDHLVISWRDTLVDSDPLDTEPTGEPLTPRQVDILQAISDGRTTADIAADTFLSPFTIRNEVRRILAKLRVRTRAEAVAVGISQRLITTRSDGPN